MLHPTLVITLDSGGHLESWYDAADLQALGDRWLPPQFIHIGRGSVVPRDRLRVVPYDRLRAVPAERQAVGEPPAGGERQAGADDGRTLAAAVAAALRALTDARARVEAVTAGETIADRVTVMLVARSSDPLCDTLGDILHDLHGVIAKLFPMTNTHVALTVLLPSLFAGSSEMDDARTYKLLRWIEASTDEANMLWLYNAPKLPLQWVWIASAINEDAHTVGQFPDTLDALTAFVQALLLGAVSAPDVFATVPGAPKRCYGSFGCAVLAGESDALRQALTSALYRTLLPRLFGVDTSSPSIAAREAERFIADSRFDRVEETLAVDRGGAPLAQFARIDWPADAVKQPSVVLADLDQYRQTLGRRLRDALLALERRQRDVQRDLGEAAKSAAGVQIDRDGCRAGEQFLEALTSESSAPVADAEAVTAEPREPAGGEHDGRADSDAAAGDQAIVQHYERYKEAAARSQELVAHARELYAARRAWLVKTLAVLPTAAVAMAVAVHAALVAMQIVSIGDLLAFYVDRLGLVVKGGGLLLAIIAGACGLQYWRRQSRPIQEAERGLREQDELVAVAADACAAAERAIVEQRFAAALRESADRVRTAVLTYARDELLANIKSFREWMTTPPAPTPVSRTLYRSPAWELDQVEKLLALTRESLDNIDSVFWATTGSRSAWTFLDREMARARLDAFARELFKRIHMLSLEDMLYHPQYGLDRKKADNLVLSVDMAAAPYLRLDDADGTFGERIVLAAGGRQSRIRELFDSHQLSAVYRDHGDPSRIVIVRTRTGFPLRALAELRACWHEYLRNAEAGGGHEAGDGEAARQRELIPLMHVEPYNRVAHAFLALWASGAIVEKADGYWMDGDLLCADRLRFYAECVANPELRHKERALIRAASGTTGKGVDELMNSRDLTAWERDLLAAAWAVKEAI